MTGSSRRHDPPQRHAPETEHRLRLADGRTLACLALGDADGPPVLYCHGFPGSRLEGRLAAGAAERPGFGASTFEPGRTIGAWAADVARLADALALERFAVVGVSGGGPYALACAACIPERVSRVALIGALGPVGQGHLSRGMVPLNRLALLLAARMPPLARFAVGIAARRVRRDPERWLARMLAGAPAADRAVLTDPAYRALFTASTAEALRPGGRGAAWELTLLARPWDFRLEEVSMPVRIWQGLDDNIVPAAMARHLAAALPRSACRYLAAEGHLSLVVRHLDAVLADLCA